MRTLLKRGGRAYQLNALPIGLHGLCRGVQPNPFQNREVMRPRRGRAEGQRSRPSGPVARPPCAQGRVTVLHPEYKDVGFAPVGGDRHGQRQLFFQKAGRSRAAPAGGERGKGIDIDRCAVQHRTVRQGIGQTGRAGRAGQARVWSHRPFIGRVTARPNRSSCAQAGHPPQRAGPAPHGTAPPAAARRS